MAYKDQDLRQSGQKKHVAVRTKHVENLCDKITKVSNLDFQRAQFLKTLTSFPPISTYNQRQRKRSPKPSSFDSAGYHFK